MASPTRNVSVPRVRRSDRSAQVSERTVVLIHGLGRTRRCFRRLRRRLDREGYRTWAATYPSMRMSIGQAAHHIRDKVLDELGPGPVCGVTHSLGAVVARLLAKELRWERLVMLAPPNSGSRLAGAMKRTHMLWLFGGRPAYELAGGAESWPSPPKPFGVIAGTRPSVLEGAQSWVGRRLGAFPAGVVHDGTVSVDETQHPEMADFATVAAGHTLLMDHPRTQELVLRFLETGGFDATRTR